MSTSKEKWNAGLQKAKAEAAAEGKDWASLLTNDKIARLRKVGAIETYRSAPEPPGEYKWGNYGGKRIVKADGSVDFISGPKEPIYAGKDANGKDILVPADEWESYKANQKAKNRERRQREYDEEQDRKFGLIPGTTSGFNKFGKGFVDAATVLVDNTVGLLPGMGQVYKAFAPPGSKSTQQRRRSIESLDYITHLLFAFTLQHLKCSPKIAL